MRDIRLIALDLDGTLLNSQKQLTERTREALDRAAEAGIELVPATGRFFGGMPEFIRALPCLHYAITSNGAQVMDLRAGSVVYRAELPWEEAVEIASFLDGRNLIYDCYQDNWGWMDRDMWENCGAHVPDEHYFRMVRELRTPVDDLKQLLRERKRGVQKLQLYTSDMELRAQLLRELGEKFPGVAVSSSVCNNVEINHADANKGAALCALAQYLRLERGQTAAFGDGLNDMPMLRAAGLGIAMGNAAPEVRSCADRVTAGNDEDGVALEMEKWRLEEEEGERG